jgi:hypothetical protein
MRLIETVGWAEHGEAQQPRLLSDLDWPGIRRLDTRLCNPSSVGFAALSTNQLFPPSEGGGLRIPSAGSKRQS